MKKNNVILLMAGTGSRLALGYNKVFYEVNKTPIYIYSLKKLLDLPSTHELYVVVNESDYELVNEQLKQNSFHANVIVGGKTRHESVKKALQVIGNNYDVLIHDAARPLTNITDIITLINQTEKIGTLYHHITDTIKWEDGNTKTIDRTKLKAVTTPQYFSKEFINDIINNDIDYTDELQIFEDRIDITYVLETTPNPKLTLETDLPYISYLLNPIYQVIGHSYDFHPFEENRRLVLGGVEIPYHMGLKGHSDADSLYHATAEAIMGALNLGDLGTLFPDTSLEYKDIDSEYFIVEVMKYVEKYNLKVVNIDAIIYIESPKLSKYKTQMAQNIKRLTNAQQVNVKATTMEKCGLVGENKGIGCEVVCLLTNK